MPDLYGVPVGLVRHELTDEVRVDFFDKATGIAYQRGGVLVPRGATEPEIARAVGRRCGELEAEAASTSPPAPSVEVPLPSAVVNRAYDAIGVFTAVAKG